MQHRKIIILGSGAAGLTAAIYVARGGIEPLVIAGQEPGGQLTIAGEVENYPGFAEPVDGISLMDAITAQAERVGAILAYETVLDVDTSSRPFILTTDQNVYSCDALIVATGAKARWLGVEGESLYRERGVSACATCDGFFFKGKDVVVVGGGNTAVEEALLLSKICANVHLVHRRDQLRAEHVLQSRLLEKTNVKLHWNKKVEKIIGNKDSSSVGGIVLSSTLSGEQTSLDCDAVFVAIGHDPASSVFKAKLVLDSAGYIRTYHNCTRTSVEGIFAAGDVADPVYRQAVTAAGMGCMAALDTMKWLENR